MAYTAGNTILDDEYNIFISGNANGTTNNTNANVNTVYGPGSGGRGYGQSELSPVTAGTVISATQWATMLNTISTIANHQNSSITAITNPNAGDPIAVLSALSGNITTITNNRFNAAANGTAITAGGVSQRTTAWNGTINTTQRITFSTANAMRYFFNAGGRITISYSRTGGSVENKNTGWSNLCTACGTINLTSTGASKTIGGTAYTGTTKIGGTGTPSILLTGTGYAQLTGTFTNIFQQYDTTVQYTLNYLTLAAAAGTNYIDLRTTFQDDANANTDENVDGTLSCTVTVHPPSTTYIANTWGTPTISTFEAL